MKGRAGLWRGLLAKAARRAGIKWQRRDVDTANRPLIVLDTETTGLDPDRHEVWEIGAIAVAPADGNDFSKPRELHEFHRFLRLDDLEHADPRALEVSHFSERYVADEAISAEQAIDDLLDLTQGGVLAGLNIGFDVGFLRPMLGLREANWHYSPLDIKSMAAGVLGLRVPSSSNDLARALGVYPENFERHTALDDCRFALAIYDAALAEARRLRVASEQ